MNINTKVSSENKIKEKKIISIIKSLGNNIKIKIIERK